MNSLKSVKLQLPLSLPPYFSSLLKISLKSPIRTKSYPSKFLCVKEHSPLSFPNSTISTSINCNTPPHVTIIWINNLSLNKAASVKNLVNFQITDPKPSHTTTSRYKVNGKIILKAYSLFKFFHVKSIIFSFKKKKHFWSGVSVPP
ncbi:hypothetical protein ACH5RR_037639 [Cinchona calisaya]|uniref:Ig-like domain-containing protein n=1 Tax=Cinchona calisaya TaxID=153742 RepID=A0ABD2YAH2_9GENT